MTTALVTARFTKLATGRFLQNGKNAASRNDPQRDCSCIHSLMEFQELCQSNDETAGNREAGGFVNSGSVSHAVI